MKKLIFSLFAIAAVFAVAGCSPEIVPDIKSDQIVKFTINTAAPQTKTYIEYDADAKTYTPNWHQGDQLGVFFDSWVKDASLQATFSNSSDNGPTGTFSGETSLSAGEHTIYAFYPAGKFAKAYNDSKLGILIPETQKPTASSYDKDADILVAAPYTLTVSGSTVEVNDMVFTRVVSLLKVVVVDQTTDGKLASDAIQSMSLTSDMTNAALTGLFQWDYVNETAAMNSKTPSVTADLTDNPLALGAPIYLMVNPTTLTGGSSLTVGITTDNHVVSKTATLSKDFVFPAGNVANLRITITDSDTVETPSNEPTGAGWYLVEDVSWLRAGDKVVITNASSNYAIGTTQNTNNRAATAVSLNEDNTLNVQSADQFTLVEGSQSGTFAFKGGDSKYLYYPKSGNYLRSSTTLDNYTSWTISANPSSETTIKNVGVTERGIRYNTANGGIFSCYTSGQTAIKIYKEYGGGSAGTDDPAITALKEAISGVAAAGVSATETGVYSLTNATDTDLTVTCDGTVVSSATVADGNVSYVVAANTDTERSGWIRLALSDEKFIVVSVSQLSSQVNPWATVYSSNVTMTAGENGSAGEITIVGTQYDAVKVGNGSAGGSMSITVPAGTTKLYMHAASWNNVSGLYLNITGAETSPSSIALTAGAGIAGNSPYSFSGDPSSSDYFFVITIPESSTETTLTFTSSSAKRFVVWGCNVDGAGAVVSTLPAQVTSSSAATLNGSFAGASGTVVTSGFLWGESEDSLTGDIQLGSQTGSSGTLTYEITTGLMAGRTYYYQAYIQVRDDTTSEVETYYGDVRPFTTWLAEALMPTGLLELPATTGTEDYVGVFYGSGGNTAPYRNYSYNYSYDHYACLWVAYPLTSAHLSGNTTKPSWTKNPNIDEDKQVWVDDYSYPTHYGVSAYSRGHQIPNADRYCDQQMRDQTYYVTNQTPQLQDKFNGTIWNELEVAERTQAGTTDTLYVVTGACYRTVGGNETIDKLTGVESTTNPTNPMSLDIPNYFWKAMLKVSRNGDGLVSASAIGFWFQHKEYEGKDYETYAVSVDEIESKTGFDLFANLPESLQASAEANTSWTSFQAFQ